MFWHKFLMNLPQTGVFTLPPLGSETTAVGFEFKERRPYPAVELNS